MSRVCNEVPKSISFFLYSTNRFQSNQKKCQNQYLPNGGPVKVGLVADVGVVPGRVHHRHRTRVEADRHLFAQELLDLLFEFWKTGMEKKDIYKQHD